MPKTAFSSRFARELDPEQLLELIGAASIDALTPEQRQQIRVDVVCSSCGASGAQIVKESEARGTSTKIRQPHFRFTGPNGQDAHNKFCEFNAEASKESKDPLINFATERSAETRFVRSLVCKGMENGIFDQGAIRGMRQWFFDLKSETRVRISATAEAIEWMEKLSSHPRHRRWPFHPCHAEMPNFDWRKAARHQFTEDHIDLMEWLFERMRASSFPRAFSRAKTLSDEHFDQEVFDRSVLKPFYEKTVDLAYFIAENSDFPKKLRPDYYRIQGAPVPLLALCALLLFVSDWNLDDSIELCARLIAAPSASDETLGNVIGLNPFHDYLAWETLAVASELAAKSPGEFEYDGILQAIEARIREEHKLWRKAQ